MPDVRKREHLLLVLLNIMIKSIMDDEWTNVPELKAPTLEEVMKLVKLKTVISEDVMEVFTIIKKSFDAINEIRKNDLKTQMGFRPSEKYYLSNYNQFTVLLEKDAILNVIERVSSKLLLEEEQLYNKITQYSNIDKQTLREIINIKILLEK